MKKIIVLASLAVLALSGCFLFQKNEEVPAASRQESVQEKKLGILSTAAAQGLISAPVEFVLATDAGEKIFVDSLTVNLRKYQKRTIEVEGQWNDGRTIFMVDSIASVNQNNQIKEEYTSPALGLKFKYPAVWFLREEMDIANMPKIVITPYEAEEGQIANVDSIVIERSENNKRLEARLWLELDDQYRSVDPINANSVFQEAIVGSALLKGVKKTSQEGNKIDFFTARDTFMYKFSFTSAEQADRDVNQAVFFEIVSSFEFIPIGPLPAGTTTLSTAASQPQIPPPPVVSPPAPQSTLSSAPSSPPQQSPAAAPPVQQETPASSQTASARQSFINYIKENISSLAPETPESGSWTVTRVEFAYPEGQPDNFNAIYVQYRDSSSAGRRILLRVSDRTNPSFVTRIAYFKPGEQSDWHLEEGQDSARDNERTAINISASASAESSEVVIRSGMRLLETRLGIKIQYPSNWYWGYISGSYKFSNHPVTAENAFVSLNKNPQTPAQMTSLANINNMTASQGANEDIYFVCVQAADQYCLSGSSTLRDTMKTMMETLQED